MRIVPLESIREGSTLGKTVYDIYGRILLNKDSILTDGIKVKLKDLNLKYLYVNESYSKHEIEDVIKPELRKRTISLIKSTFDNIKISPDNFSELDENLINVTHLAEKILNSILANNDVMCSLVDIKDSDKSTYDHSVNVAIISLILGISVNLSYEELLDLCVGALLHDIGKVFIPKEILLKNGPLTFNEYELMKQHPTLGYNFLKTNMNISDSAKMIVLHHHEKIDGLGYPRGLTGDSIPKLVQISSIADVYEALTADRCYRDAMCGSDALEFVMSNAGTTFDFELVKVFSRIIVPFPYGTVVKLSNGDIAQVLNTIPNYPLRPNIKILKSSNEKLVGTTINLVEKLSIVISSLEKNYIVT